MKNVSMAGVAVGALALILALAALLTRPGGADDVRAGLETLRSDLASLDERVKQVQVALAAAAAEAGDGGRTIEDLSARVKRAEAEAARLGRAVADIPVRPAAGGAGVDQEKLREVVQAEMQAARDEQAREMADRFRQGMITRLRDDLGLDEEKAGKVADVQRKTFEDMPRIWRESRGDRDAVQKAMEELRGKAEKEMAEFLTEDELAKLREWGDQQMQRWGGGNRGNRGNRGGRNRPGRDAGQGAGEGGGGDAPAPF